MNSISEILKIEKSIEVLHNNDRRTERGELLVYFVDNLRDMKGKKYKISYIGMRLAHLSIKDLYYLQSICKGSDNFGRTFFGSIKNKK